jgi:DNA-binding NarL/FixJ family response regulator
VSVRIAVSDPLPLYRRGVITALGSAGFHPDEPENLLEWMAEEQKLVVLITLESSRDWTLLRQLRSRWPDSILIALLGQATAETYAKAMEGGASAAVERNARPEMVLQVLNAAVGGKSLLPVEAVRALAAPPALPRANDLAAREVEWLRALSQGMTVAQLAEHVGYSERAMYRLLREVYARMNVANRTEAVVKASREGWL